MQSNLEVNNSNPEIVEEYLSFSENSDDENDIPRGQPKSGRFWKTEKARTKSVVQTPGLKISLEKKLKLRQDLRYNRSKSREIIDKRNKAKQAKRESNIKNRKKKEENRKKSEIVQVISNLQKLKKVKKKHLRFIQKRDTLTMGK